MREDAKWDLLDLHLDSSEDDAKKALRRFFGSVPLGERENWRLFATHQLSEAGCFTFPQDVVAEVLASLPPEAIPRDGTHLRIRYLRDDGRFKAGDLSGCPNAEADRLVDAGIAELVPWKPSGRIERRRIAEGLDAALREMMREEIAKTKALSGPPDSDPNWIYGWTGMRDALSHLQQAASRQAVEKRIKRAEKSSRIRIERGTWEGRPEHVRVWRPELERFASMPET